MSKFITIKIRIELTEKEDPKEAADFIVHLCESERDMAATLISVDE